MSKRPLLFALALVLALVATVARAEDKPALARAEDQSSGARSEEQPKPTPKLMLALPYAVLVAGNAADVITSRDAFARGCHEGNPLFGTSPSTTRMVAQKAMFLAPVVAIMALTNKHGHHAPAWIAAVVNAGISGVAVNNNLHCGR